MASGHGSISPPPSPIFLSPPSSHVHLPPVPLAPEMPSVPLNRELAKSRRLACAGRDPLLTRCRPTRSSPANHRPPANVRDLAQRVGSTPSSQHIAIFKIPVTRNHHRFCSTPAILGTSPGYVARPQPLVAFAVSFFQPVPPPQTTNCPPSPSSLLPTATTLERARERVVLPNSAENYVVAHHHLEILIAHVLRPISSPGRSDIIRHFVEPLA
ncbi:hypothetical protein F5Y08DRAFT_348183 [Xylaria arbuscula]|nr:hypothetical protein F5Y08DRAFT_348183 [Xylaria arbuscula]